MVVLKESYIKRHKEAAHEPKIETNCDICGGKYISRHVKIKSNIAKIFTN